MKAVYLKIHWMIAMGGGKICAGETAIWAIREGLGLTTGRKSQILSLAPPGKRMRRQVNEITFNSSTSGPGELLPFWVDGAAVWFIKASSCVFVVIHISALAVVMTAAQNRIIPSANNSVWAWFWCFQWQYFGSKFCCLFFLASLLFDRDALIPPVCPQAALFLLVSLDCSLLVSPFSLLTSPVHSFFVDGVHIAFFLPRLWMNTKIRMNAKLKLHNCLECACAFSLGTSLRLPTIERGKR